MKLPFKVHLGQLAGLVVVIYLGVTSIHTVERNYQLQQQISSLQQQSATLKSQDAQLNYDIKYFQTDDYRQKVARAELGLEAPGETEIILPVIPKTNSQSTTTAATTAKPKSNAEQWWEFLFN